MSERLKNKFCELKVLSQAKPDARRAIIAQADGELIRAICECCLNILNGTVKLTPKQKKRLTRHKNCLRDLADKKQSLKSKREKLITQRGGALPALLAPIIGLAASLIGDLFRK